MIESSKPKLWRFDGLFARLLLVLFLGFSLGGLLFVFAQSTQDYRLAQFPSPANPANEIWFHDSGFLDRDLSLYAKSERQNAQFVARLDETGAFRLAAVQWTKDGRAVVCSLILLGEISSKGNTARTESDLPT